MRIAAIDRIEPARHDDPKTIEMVQRTSLLPALTKLLVSLAGVAVFLAPFTLIVAHAATDPASATDVVHKPVSLVLALLGLGLALALLMHPLVSSSRRLGGSQKVRIASGRVTVEERSLLGRRSWSQPLASYLGLAHHIRASLSGTRHELILVHADPAFDVLVEIGDRAQHGAREMAGQLGLDEVSARLLYARRRSAEVTPLDALNPAAV